MARKPTFIIKDLSTFDVKRIRYGKKTEKIGDNFVLRSVPPMYEYPDGTVAPLKIQTPRGKLPFGLSRFHDKKTDKVTYSVPIALSNLDSDEEMKMFVDILKAIDEYNIGYIQKHKAELYAHDPDLKDSTIEDRYVKSIKRPKPGTDYPPTFQPKSNYSEKTGKVYTGFYDENKQVIESDKCVPFCEGILLVELAKLWMLKDCGPTWTVRQVKVYENDNMNGVCHIGDSDEEDEEEGMDSEQCDV